MVGYHRTNIAIALFCSVLGAVSWKLPLTSTEQSHVNVASYDPANWSANTKVVIVQYRLSAKRPIIGRLSVHKKAIIIIMWQCFIVTSPTGAAAQYCDEYVCLSVCSREYLQNHTCDFYQIFLACCHWLWLGPTLEGWWHSKGKGQFWGFSHWQCIVQNSIWDPYKNGWTNQDIVLDDEWAWPEEHCVTWGWRSPKGKLQLWGKTCLTSLTPARIANWTGPWSSMHTIGTDAWLQVLDESIIGCKGGGLHTGRSLISMSAVFIILCCCCTVLQTARS